MRYKNNETGNIYIFLCIASNATNGENNGQLMAVYHPDNEKNDIQVIDENEFYEKFTLEV